MENFEKLKKIIADIEESGDMNIIDNSSKGMQKATTRIRKAMQEVKNTAQALRADVVVALKAKQAATKE